MMDQSQMEKDEEKKERLGGWARGDSAVKISK